MLKQPGDTILLVEDEEAAILLVRHAVACCPGDMQLVVARDTVEALEWLTDAAEHGYSQPCLILLNLKLPKLAGLAVLRTVRMDAHLQDVPVVVYSESHEPSDVVLSYQLGANSFVNKPVDLGELTQLLHELSGLGWLSGMGVNQRCQQPLQL